MFLRILVFLILLLPLGAFAAEQTVELRKGHPYRYVVKPGDTLWKISTRFLKHPWQWQQVWQANPQIEHPNDIYPGDILELHLVDGKAQIQLHKQGGTLRLSPRVRVMQLRKPIPTIPLDAIKPFLSQTRVVEKIPFLKAPYIVSMVGEHVTGGAGSEIYVRGLLCDSADIYSIYRLGDKYVDPETKQILGYQGTYVGKAQLVKQGDPSTLNLLETAQEALDGDRLFPALDQEYTTHFIPHAPGIPVKASIIAVLGGISQIGEYDSVVLDRGKNDGVNVGEVLEVYRRGHVINDPVTHYQRFKKVRLPNRKAGVLMVYRSFPRISYALIMDASLPIHVLDLATNPDLG